MNNNSTYFQLDEMNRKISNTINCTKILNIQWNFKLQLVVNNTIIWCLITREIFAYSIFNTIFEYRTYKQIGRITYR